VTFKDSNIGVYNAILANGFVGGIDASMKVQNIKIKSTGQVFKLSTVKRLNLTNVMIDHVVYSDG